MYAWYILYIYIHTICYSLAYAVFSWSSIPIVLPISAFTLIHLSENRELLLKIGMHITPVMISQPHGVAFEHLGWWFRICFMFNPRKGVRFPISKGLFHHQLVTLGLFQWLEVFLCIPEDHWETGFAFGQAKGGGKHQTPAYKPNHCEKPDLPPGNL